MTFVFALVRAAHFLSLMAIFGAETLRFLLASRLTSAPKSCVPESVFEWAAIAALATSLLWFLLMTGQAAGDTSAMFDRNTLWTMATATSFGPFFVARIAACGALCVAVFGPRTRTARLFLSGFALADIAFTGHVAASGASFAWLRITSDAVHLLTAGFWFGALVELAPLVIANRAAPDVLLPALRVFSRWAAIAVFLLILAGVANSVMILYAAPQSWSAIYLTLLAAKITLAALMVGLALANRFSLVPGIGAGDPEAGRNLIGSVVTELATAAVLVVIVGFLGLIAPLGT